MTVIKQDDLIDSVADALQFISYYHPVDFIRAMRKAYDREESPAAKAALTQVLAVLKPERLDEAVRIAELPLEIRGFEDLKLARVNEYRQRLGEALERL